jgi:hypothetical protein
MFELTGVEKSDVVAICDRIAMKILTS